MHQEDLLKKLRTARLHASVGAMSEAERHVRMALRLIDSAPRDSSSRSVRGYIAEAAFGITQSNSRFAVSSLDEAVKELDEKPRAVC